MLKSTWRWLFLTAALAFPLAGCSKKAAVKPTLSELERVFPAEVATPAQSAAPMPTTPPQNEANNLVNRAVAAARDNDYAAGVIALQAATDKPGITAEQVLAIQDAKQAMVGELQRRAARGDQAALSQLRAIEKTRSQ